MLEVDARIVTINLEDYKLACTLRKGKLVKTIYSNKEIYTSNHNVNGKNKCLIASGQLKGYEVIKEGNHFLLTEDANKFKTTEDCTYNATVTKDYLILITLETPSTLVVIDRQTRELLESANYSG